MDPILDELRKVDELIRTTPSDENLVQEITVRREAIYHWIKEKCNQTVSLSFADQYSAYINDLQDFIGTLPEFHKEEQSPARFIRLETDGWYLRFKKYFKYKAYQVTLIPVKTTNFFLRIFKKKPKPIRYWNHTIPIHGSVKKAYQSDLLKALLKAESRKYQSLLGTFLNLKLFENQTDIEIRFQDGKISLAKLSDPDFKNKLGNLQQEITSNERKYSKETREVLKLEDKNFLDIMDKVHTLELPKKHLDDKRLLRRFNKYNNAWLENSKGWYRTLYALFDDWLLDLEINQLKYIAYKELFLARKQLEKEKSEYLASLLKLSDLLNDFETTIHNGGATTRKKLQAGKIAIRKKVSDQIVPEIINQYDGKALTGIVSQIEIKLEREINVFSDSRALVKTDQYRQPLRDQDISYIKPNELLSFEVFKDFLNLTTKLKNAIFNQLEAIIKLIPDIDNIVSFSLDTAINATELDQEQINSENIQIVLNGIKRARNRISEIKKLVEELFINYDNQLIESTLKFTTEAVGLMQNENALLIQFKLLKAKALAQTISYKDKIKNHLFKFTDSIRVLYKDNIYVINKNLRSVRKRYFLQPSDAIITQELSEFLSKSENLINHLPVIYRRLYKVEPVTDMDLFVGREIEFEAVQSSYQNWISGRASSTVIIGEKWGGISSLINYLIVNMKFKYPVVRVYAEQKYYRKGIFYRFLTTSLSIDESSDQEGLIDAIKNFTSKRIVIIEDIQHLYLRSVNGFDAMKSLIEIVNQTQHEIFWIFTCTQYAWNYLVKSIQINDYFSKVVLMKSMNEEEISAVIRKRNQIGGFNIVFIPPDEYSEYKKFTSSSEEEQQNILEKRFLKRLNDFAASNISMALIFWLLSTRKVTEDHISVGDFDNPDQSFIQVMTQTRIFILLALILHDGLSLKELSLVNNLTQGELRLQISSLQEDGIIIRQADLYMVNPLIYRNVILVLKSKNLIH